MATPSAADSHPRQTRPVLDTEMSYVDIEGSGPPVIFLHGNPTSSYLWRNVIPPVAGRGNRCLAPDLVGMGRSGAAPAGEYTFREHSRYLDAWFDDVLGDEAAYLVIHDWGSALGFHRWHRFPERVRGIAYMEAIVQPIASWDEWPENARRVFQGMRSEAGEAMVLDKNIFVERILPSSVLRDMGEDEMARYRERYVEPGESRRPTLTWPRQIPIAGEPAEVVEIAGAYATALAASDDLPKLFVNAEPGSILVGQQRDFCRTWPNQREVTVPGLHFVQEDSPQEIGDAVASWLEEVST